MDITMAKSISCILQDLGVSMVYLIGGEPTLWPHLLEFNRFALELGIKTSIITNAIRFGNDEFWSQYKEIPNTIVGVSIKAPSKEILFDVAGANPDTFRRLEIGIRRATGSFRCGVDVTYNSCYRKILPDVAKFAMDNGAKTLRIDFCTTTFNSGEPVSDYMVLPSEIVSNILRDYDRLIKITGDNLYLGMNMPLCLWPKDFVRDLVKKDRILSVCHIFNRCGIIFGVDGKIMMCNTLFDYPIGELGVDFCDAQSLSNFLNQGEILSYYDRMTSLPHEKCRDCDIYSWCGGGCPLKWAVYNPNEMIK